ncbi:MAG: 50S ribosomal protein L29 [Candidatus Altiarchaeota archaeon]|nr:50S ribosomal protein L29 [Candidatus Altiarchaeota archaeon]
MKNKELKAMSKGKLVDELKNSRLELMKIKTKKKLGTAEKPSMVKNAKKRVAKVLTFLNQKVN